MPVELLYMNQGGGGNWGAIPYAGYDILCLAEGSVVKEGFSEVYNSRTKPPMSVQINDKSGRIVTKPYDLDGTLQEVRPMVCFQVTGINVMVVFVHLKSGDVNYATSALENAVAQYLKVINGNTSVPTLWIGDYNRAVIDPLTAVFDTAKVLFKGGGVAKWSLDRAIITGSWGKIKVITKEVSRSGDNQHVGIRVSFS